MRIWLPMKQVNLLYPELSFKIRGACYEVYNQLSGVYRESVFEKALMVELEDRGLSAERQKRIKLTYKGRPVGIYIPDIIVEDKVLMELKSKPVLLDTDRQQFWNYLKGSEYKVGFLVNFGNKIEIIRRVYDRARQHNQHKSAISAI